MISQEGRNTKDWDVELLNKIRQWRIEAEELAEVERQRAEAERQRAEALEAQLAAYRERFGELNGDTSESST
ncbi:hypothetical protein [Vacuolonema iberomarrocanum]|uniref:hypothetical protein n=1 Tax=Vacuolonema iberomarrocanum TaxID=3454632 RepID=UPI003F6DC0A5